MGKMTFEEFQQERQKQRNLFRSQSVKKEYESGELSETLKQHNELEIEQNEPIDRLAYERYLNADEIEQAIRNKYEEDKEKALHEKGDAGVAEVEEEYRKKYPDYFKSDEELGLARMLDKLFPNK